MRVAVKYCGGCNCSYDRVAMVEQLRRQFPAVAVVSAELQDGIQPDLVLVVCGCSSVCAAHDHLEGRHGKVIAARAGDYEAVRAAVEDFLSQ
jgi:phosphoribosylformylglycinamidine (FGAM) synthase-like amidotransferase family enzyme